MNKNWLRILLIISLAFNVAAIASSLILRKLPRPYPRVPRVRQERMQLPHRMRDLPEDAEICQMRSHFDSTRVELMRTLAQDPVNEDKANAIIDRSLDLQGSLERVLGNRLLSIRKQMSAAEADAYFNASANHIEHNMQRYKELRNRRQYHEKDNRNKPRNGPGRRHPAGPESRP